MDRLDDGRFGEGCRIKLAPQVLYQDLGDEAVLLNLESGVYYGLNGVGARLLALLQAEPQLKDAHRQLHAEFDVSSDRLWTDIRSLLADAFKKGLILVDADQEAADHRTPHL